MQQHKIVEDYLNSVIPQKISDSTKAELRAEIECHIYDKAEFYMEIGYDEEAAFGKAVEEMGETEEVKAEFERLYKDSDLKAWLCFGGILVCNLLALFSGFAYFTIDTMDVPSAFLVLLSSLFAGFVILLIFHAKSHKLQNRIFAIGTATGLMLLFAILTNAIYQPMFYGLGYNIEYFINAFTDKDFSEIPGTMAPLGAWCFLLLIIFLCIKKIRKRINLKALAVVLLLFATANTYIFYNTEITDDYTPELYAQEDVADYYPYYSAINENMSYAEADAYMKKEGFVDCIGYIDYAKKEDVEYGEDFNYSYALEEMKEILNEALAEKEGNIYFTKIAAEEQYTRHYIVLSKDATTKVYVYNTPYSVANNKTLDALKSKECFLNLKQGDKKADVDKQIETMGFKVYEKSVKLDGKIITEYNLEFESTENIPSWKNFFDIYYCEECRMKIYLKFDNGELSDGKMEYDYYNFLTEEDINDTYTLSD